MTRAGPENSKRAALSWLNLVSRIQTWPVVKLCGMLPSRRVVRAVLDPWLSGSGQRGCLDRSAGHPLLIALAKRVPAPKNRSLPRPQYHPSQILCENLR